MPFPRRRPLVYGVAGLIIQGCGAVDHIEDHDTELEISGELTRTSPDNSDFKSDFAAVDVYVGYHLNENFAIGPVINYSHSSFGVNSNDSDTDVLDNDVDADTGLGGLRVRYNFPVRGAVIPFLEAEGGIAYRRIDVENGTRVDDTDDFFGGGAGARFFFTERAALDVKARYRRIEFSDSVGGSTDQYGLLLGLSLFF